MKTTSLKTSKIVRLAAIAIAITPILLIANPAAADPGMDGSYLGVGVSAGVTEAAGNDSEFGGTVQGRFDIPNAPISLRGAVLFGGETVSLSPAITYDVGIANNTNLYAGAGYSFIANEGENTQLGNNSAPMLLAGVESAVNSNVVIFGDAKLAFDAYENSSAAALSFQVGVGYRF